MIVKTSFPALIFPVFMLMTYDEHFRGLLESQAKFVIKKALNNFSVLDHLP